MATDHIEDAEWEELPTGATDRAPGRVLTPNSLGSHEASDVPWTSADFWSSIGASIRKLAILVAVVIALLTLVGLLLSPEQNPTADGQTPSVLAPPTPPVQRSVEPSAAATGVQYPTAGNLTGIWVQAESGGEDGRTKCADAEVMTTFNGGSTSELQFFRNGQVQHTLWFDPEFESRGEPRVKSAYNAGTWELSGNRLSIAWQGGNTGLFGSDLPAGDLTLEIAIQGNVMTHSQGGGTMRLVRCR